jgi:hypothetical protein
MLRVLAGTSAMIFVLLGGSPIVSAMEDIKRDTIGPWQIGATFRNDKFEHCAINRKVDDVTASFVHTDDGLGLALQSPNWKLERGKNYPVHMKAGAVRWDTQVAAETNSVSVPISDKRFDNGLRLANELIVAGAGATIRIPLDQSRVALGRLDECVAKNSSAIETNPFVAPSRQP